MLENKCRKTAAFIQIIFCLFLTPWSPLVSCLETDSDMLVWEFSKHWVLALKRLNKYWVRWNVVTPSNHLTLLGLEHEDSGGTTHLTIFAIYKGTLVSLQFWEGPQSSSEKKGLTQMSRAGR